MIPIYRTESDLIGTLRVLDDAYYGIQTVRAVENFPITEQRMHPAFIRALGLVKVACIQANMDIGLMPTHIGKALVDAAREVAEGRWDHQFLVDPIQGGAGTSFNMNANEVITNRALEILGHPKGTYRIIHPNVHANMAQSTNDVVPTAFRIALCRRVETAVDALQLLITSLLDKAAAFDAVLKVGRTHLQDAVPIRLGQSFHAFAHVARRDVERLRAARETLLEVNIGATAVGTGLNADPAYVQRVIDLLQELTGLPIRVAQDLLDATQNVDRLVHLSGVLKTIAVNLTKIANDLRLMASGPRAGLGEIRLPARQPGSSIMPGKVNPVIPEVVNQVAFQVIGNDTTVTLAAQAGQLELNVMQPVLNHNLLQSVDILRNAVEVFTRHCVAGIEANEAHCRQQVEASAGIATALNPYIGYELASEVAKESLETGRPVREVVVERNLLSPEALDRLLVPDALTRGQSVTMTQTPDSR